MSKARRALAWSFTSQYLNTVLQFATTVIISRLLTPAEIGVYSLAASFVLLGHLLRDFGSGQYIIQEQELTDDRIRAAFTVTMLSGWLVAAAVFLLAPYAAAFFEHPGVEKVMHLLAVNFALIPFGSVTMAYLQRQLRFRRNMLVRVLSSLTGSVTSVSCAFAGLSYISLAWGAVAGSVATIILANLVRPAGLPLLPGFKEIPRVLSFASLMSSSSIVTQAGPMLNDMIVGKLLGVTAVGLMSRTRGTLRLFETLVMRGVNPVLTPLFAEKHRDGHQLGTSYLYGVTCLSGVQWPFYAGLLVVSHDFINVLFGANWLAISPLIQITCIAVMLRAPTVLANHLFIGTGNVGLLLRRQLIVIPVGVASTFALSHISLMAVVLAGPPIALLWLALVLPQVKRIAGISWRDLLHALRPSAVVALASTGAVWLAVHAVNWLGVDSSFLRLLAGASLGGGCYLLVLFKTSHPLAAEGLRAWRKLKDSRNAQRA